MSVAIIGGNECMIRRYTDICKEYRCKAKVYPKMNKGVKNIGCPDLMILFTDTVSHKLVRTALGDVTDKTTIIRSHSSSASALKNILEEYVCQKNQ